MPKRVRPTVRTCLNCGASLSLELGFASFCSASCVWEGERLRNRTEEALAALRAEAEERAGRTRRRGLFGRLRAQVELDEDAATVIAMNAAGATARQIARYTALEPSDVDRLLAGDRGGPAARAEARARRRRAGADEAPHEDAPDAGVAQAS